MATADIRFKRMRREYENLHDTQDETLDRLMAHLDVPPKSPAGFVKK